jgi:hypothetical protein
MPTQFGSAIYHDYQAGEDATAVGRYSTKSSRSDFGFVKEIDPIYSASD